MAHSTQMFPILGTNLWMAFHCLSLAMIMMSLGILTGHDLQNAMLYTDQQTQWEILQFLGLTAYNCNSMC